MKGDPAVTVLPWRAAGMALVAFSSLAMSIESWPVLAPLALLLLAHYAVRFRLPESPWLVWPLRLAFFGAVFSIHFARPNDFIDFGAPWASATSLVGELAAVELALQVWRRHPSGGRRGEAAIVLSAIVLLTGFNVYIGSIWPQLIAPLYFILLAFHLRAMRERTDRVSSPGAVVALLVVLPGAIALNYGIAASRGALMRLDASFLRWLEPKAGDLSDAPQLGRGPGEADRMERVLLVDGPLPELHLRAMTFDQYAGGGWRPPMSERGMRIATGADLNATATGPRTRIRRFPGLQRGVVAPLHAEGVILPPDARVSWDASGGGEMACFRADGLAWIVVPSPEANHQGPLCRPLTTDMRARYLKVPDTVRSTVRGLAGRLGAGRAGAMEQVEAVKSYLLANHRYSLDVDPGEGDPVSNFLDRKLSAHCEYFASASTILLRCLGVPSRYVVGYYAHEDAGDGRIVVRARDAHAWSEAWVEEVGWVTVEATPAAGLPANATDGPSLARRLWEGIRDAWSSLVAWFSDFSWEKLGVLVVAALSTFILVRAVRALLRRWRSRVRRERPFAYSGTGGAFGELARRFERALRRHGRPCPAGRTWREHCAGDGALLAFVTAYEAARFGGLGDGEAVAALSERLRGIERARHDGGKA